MMSLYVSEIKPSIQLNKRVHTGRGGAGNVYKTPSANSPSLYTTTTPTRIPTTSSASSSLSSGGTKSSKFSSGRGGAGNIKLTQSEATEPSLDELLARKRREQNSTTGHVGRGGAGNCAGRNGSKEGSSGSKNSVLRRLSDSLHRI